ncbi:uncharacterized protein LOC142337270 isoform X3 [Convolutriloba macropyga]|uniref:uncharacterized protein LOC142337270 isoform X3 n=1 Tax=Convolutriloba macropyga TaxID=536237 RepID=UPI003F51F2D0
MLLDYKLLCLVLVLEWFPLNGLGVQEPETIYKASETLTRSDLMHYTFDRSGGQENSSRCGGAISTYALDFSPVYKAPLCPPSFSGNIFLSVNYSLVFFDKDLESLEPQWTVLLHLDLDPNGLGDVNGFWVHYNSQDVIHPLYDETMVLFTNSPLEPQDFNKLKSVALREPYRPNDIFDLTICPMPFCGKVGSYCHNMTIKIPGRSIETEKFPVLIKNEDKCSKISPDISSKKLISYEITQLDDDYYQKMQNSFYRATSVTAVDSRIIINFIPRSDLDRTLIVISDSLGDVIRRYLCPLAYYSESALIVYHFAQQGLESEPHMLTSCLKIEPKENSSKLQLSNVEAIFGLSALVILAILAVLVYFVIRKRSTGRRRKASLSSDFPDIDPIGPFADADISQSSGEHQTGSEKYHPTDTSFFQEQKDFLLKIQSSVGQLIWPLLHATWSNSRDITNQNAINSSAYYTSINVSNVTSGMGDESMAMPNQMPNNFSAFDATINTANVTTGLDVPKELDKKAPVNESANKTLDCTNATEEGQTSYNPGDRFKLNTSTLTPSVGTSDQHVEDSTISVSLV